MIVNQTIENKLNVTIFHRTSHVLKSKKGFKIKLFHI